MKRVWLSFAVLLAFFAASPASAKDEVHITADHFVVEEDSNLATFTGNVVAVQSTTTINADKIEVTYGAGGASDIKDLSASGHLVITMPTHKITGLNGRYDPSSRVMRVTGNVVAESASGRVTGTELTINFATNTSEFETKQGERVEATFNP